MATAPATAPPPPVVPATHKHEIIVISHSFLFYWWPVWAFGFIMAAITWFGGERMITVPDGTKAYPAQTLKGVADESRDILVLPKDKHLLKDSKGNPAEPHLHMSSNKNLGVLFCFVLLIVITITNVPLRGLWSVIVIIILLGTAIIFAVLGWWENIIEYLGFLDIRINLAGYLVIACVLFILWLLIFLLFDQQIYMVFSPGQFRVRLEIGDAETAYDTAGMTIQKQRSDLFRHWILGFGSGDLIIRPVGVAYALDLPNVLSVSRVVHEVEQLIKEKIVIEAPADVR